MTRDFHAKPFDEGTNAKLRLLESYIAEWLPVFVMSKKPGRINIVDFFAGPGKDRRGCKGSPLLALEKIREYTAQIRKNKPSIRLLLNEKVKRKAAMLKKTMKSQCIPEGLCAWEVTSFEFDEAFRQYYSQLNGCANLLFLGQTGVRFISDGVFRKIIDLPMTDFIFFIASSSLRRFCEHPHIRKHLEIPKETISATSFNDTHRQVTSYYRQLIPKLSPLHLCSFSIKKGSNLYGIIFGSAHPLGIEKFLRACWKEDPIRGEANFDIDAEMIDPDAPHLFPYMDKSKKQNLFELELQQQILAKNLKSDGDVYLFALEEGFLPKYARDVLIKMMNEGLVCMVERGKRPRVSIKGFKGPRMLRVD